MPSPLPLPQQTLVEQSWSQAGISPRGSPCHPTPLHPQILGSVFTFSFECQRGGAGLGGALERLCLLTLSCPHLHPQGREAPPTRAGSPSPATATTGV